MYYTPSIYCDKKQAVPGEEITMIAELGVGVWDFTNALSGDIEIVSGELGDSVITFKCLNEYDPLIIKFLRVYDIIKNGSRWVDSTGTDVIGDYWRTSTTAHCQILTGWNFRGRSQRVMQSALGLAYITQDNLTIGDSEYSVSLDYRSTVDIELDVGGHTYELPPTLETSPAPIYPILHTDTILSVVVSNSLNTEWIFPDDTYTSDNVISRRLKNGTSYLICTPFDGVSINFISSDNHGVCGSLSDIPSGISSFSITESNIHGDIAEISHIVDVVDIRDCPVYGDIAVLGGLTTKVNLRGTSVSGIIPSDTICPWWVLDLTGLSEGNIEDSLVALVDSGINGGYVSCKDGMPTLSTVRACGAIHTLESRGWTVIVNSDCAPY
jgi:hypothetical protein